jgi:hypothetical protein
MQPAEGRALFQQNWVPDQLLPTLMAAPLMTCHDMSPCMLQAARKAVLQGITSYACPYCRYKQAKVKRISKFMMCVHPLSDRKAAKNATLAAYAPSLCYNEWLLLLLAAQHNAAHPASSRLVYDTLCSC